MPEVYPRRTSMIEPFFEILVDNQRHLQSKSMDWFLYDRDFRHEAVK